MTDSVAWVWGIVYFGFFDMPSTQAAAESSLYRDARPTSDNFHAMLYSGMRFNCNELHSVDTDASLKFGLQHSNQRAIKTKAAAEQATQPLTLRKHVLDNKSERARVSQVGHAQLQGFPHSHYPVIALPSVHKLVLSSENVRQGERRGLGCPLAP